MMTEANTFFINVYYNEGPFLRMGKIQIPKLFLPFSDQSSVRKWFDDEVNNEWQTLCETKYCYPLKSSSVMRDLIDQMTTDDLEDKLACVLERVWMGGFSFCEPLTQKEKIGLLFLLKDRLKNHTCLPLYPLFERFNDRNIFKAIENALSVSDGLELFQFFFQRLAQVRKANGPICSPVLDKSIQLIKPYNAFNESHSRKLEQLVYYSKSRIFAPKELAFDNKENDCCQPKNFTLPADVCDKVCVQKTKKLLDKLLKNSSIWGGNFLVEQDNSGETRKCGCIIYKNEITQAKIKMVVVLNSDRFKGFATRLLTYTISYLKKRGIENIYCNCPLLNYGALNFFFKNNFVPESFCKEKSRLTLAYAG